jgi:hypothetical protein
MPKQFKTAIFVSTMCAVITWCAVYFAIHEPATHHMPDGSIVFVIGCYDNDDAFTALLGACSAYIVVFIPLLIFPREKISKDVFTSQRPSG